MSAKPERQPERQPENKHRDVVTKFRDEYGIALADAEVSRLHTETEGWQKLYAHQRKTERDERRRLSQHLNELADRMESAGLDEEGEKELTGVKKDSEHLRDCTLAFNVQTVDPVRAPAEQCRKLIAAAVESARLEEERAPLHNVGLEEVMRQAVRDVAKVRWNDDVGLILVGTGDEEK